MLVYVKLFPGIFSENKVTAIVSTPVKLDTSNLNKLSVSFATRPEATNTDADELKLSDTRLAIPCIMHLSTAAGMCDHGEWARMSNFYLVNC